MSAFNIFKRAFIYSLPVHLSKLKSCASRGIFHTSIVLTVNAVSQPADQIQDTIESTYSKKSLLQRANSHVVASTSQLLIMSSTLLIEYHQKYRSRLENILYLMNETLTFINSENHQEKLWNEMVAARAEMNDSKSALTEMQSYMEYIEKLVTAVAETAYLSDSVFASTSICELFSSTQQKVEMENSKTKELELEYQRQHKAFIEKMAEKGEIPQIEEESN